MTGGHRHHKMVGISVSITEKAKTAIDRQAASRGVASSLWAGQLFDIGFAAVCAREKSMPISDADLDAIAGATLILSVTDGWDIPQIARGLGVPETTVRRILDGWKQYRRAGA